MSTRIFLTVFAALNIIGGLGCVIAPAAMLASFGVVLPDMGLVIYQFWGASTAAIGGLVCLFRDQWDAGIPVPMAGVLAALNGANTVIAVRGQFAGANAAGWTMVALYALFALAFLAAAIRSPRH